MADPLQVKALMDELARRGLPDDRGVKMATEERLRRALDAGMSANQILGVVSNPASLTRDNYLNNNQQLAALTVATRSFKEAAKQAEEQAEIDIGRSALGLPVTTSGFTQPGAQQGGTTQAPPEPSTLREFGWVQNPLNQTEWINPATGERVDLARFGPQPAAAPTPRFGFQQIGGQIYRSNDLTGALEPTGISAPGFTSIQTDRAGNLTGIDQNGQFQIIQPGFSFAEIDPERTQSLAEAGATGFFGGRPTLAREQFGEQQRQADIGFGLTARGQNFQLAPQLGQLAIQQNEFIRDVTRNPSDWMYRAATQRGEASPQPFVSQADIINRLRADLENINAFFSQMQQPPRRPVTGETVWVDPARPVAPEAPRAPQAVPQAAPQPAPTPAATNAITVPVAPPAPTRTWAESGEPDRPPATPSFNFPRPAAQAPQTIASVPMDQRQLLRMEKGGHGFNMVITGDSSDGKPNEELVIDLPGDAGMAVIPMDDIKGAPKKKKGGKVPYAQDGGLFSFDMQPRIPTIPAFDQNNLRQIARENVAPAVRDVFAGQRPSPLRFEFALPTIGQTSSLTRAEREAADPYLATLYNTTMADVKDAQRFFFGPTQSRPQAVRVR